MKAKESFWYLLLFISFTGCQQVEGPQGYNSLIDIQDVPAGPDCSTGGYKIITGIDVNNNDVLDSNEVQNTKYICNGVSGINGDQGSNSLIKIEKEPIGNNCTTGGYKISTGIDVDRNDSLTNEEVQNTQYICNGGIGTNSMILAVPEAPGVNCANGGYMINTGNDMNNNGVLDSTEIESSVYICNGENATGQEPLQITKVDGYVQKGPFTNGTSVTISELDSNLYLTGRVFIAQITDNKGSFEVDNIELASEYVSLRADGYYFNEITGEQSVSQISMFALSDLTNKNSVNINLLSDLKKPRVEYLVTNDSSFNGAKIQAQSEILAIFDIRKTDIKPSEELDISQAGDDNAILLATSLILQGYRTEGELTELLSNISSDIRKDGMLNNTSLGSELINHAVYLDTVRIRHNLEQRYAGLGVTATIPDFEYYIKNFINNTTFPITATVIDYPASGLYGKNLLDLDKTQYTSTSLSVAANLPKGISLKIRISAVNNEDWGYTLGTENNWSIASVSGPTKSWELTSINSGTSCDILITFNPGSYKIEYFETGSDTPSRTKTVTLE